MGSCMGRCFTNNNLPKFRKNSESYDDFNILIDQTNFETAVPKKSKRNNFMARILSKKNSTSIKQKKPVLELVEELFQSTPGSSYSRLNRPRHKKPNPSTQMEIPMQCLDVRALISRSMESPRNSPGSSLDLEWEHETLPISVQEHPSNSSWAVLPEENLPELTSSSENTAKGVNVDMSEDWSKADWSSADSLEWDPGQRDTPTGSVDADTRQLLQEIEILTDQALRETGTHIES